MKDFADLSPAKQEEFIARYYANESVKNLVKEFELNVQPRRLVNKFPPETLDTTCEYCGTFLVRTRVSKNNSHHRRERETYCPKCLHRPLIQNCTCEGCREKVKTQKQQIRDRIRERYTRDLSPIDIADLNMLDRVYLGSLVRACVGEDLYHVCPYDESSRSLAPTSDCAWQIYNELVQKNVIVVDPSSPIDAFEIDQSGQPKGFNPFHVKYTLNILYPENKMKLFMNILTPDFFNSNMADAALAIWKEIATYECIQYLIYRLDKVGFGFKAGEKTYSTFKTMLNDFSVSQIYSIIWKSVKDACQLYQEKKMMKPIAANCTVSLCRKYAENIKVNGWHVYEYQRLYDLPQSEISMYFFNEVVKIGDKGFSRVPNLEDLGKLPEEITGQADC